eukprot:266496_1
MVVPSIFAYDDIDIAKISLSPIISGDAMKTGLSLNMMCYSMTDESTDDEDNKLKPNAHRNSTVRHTLQTSKRIIDYALHNSPENSQIIEQLQESPYTNCISPTMTSSSTPTPTPGPTSLTLRTSDTGLAILADISDFVNESDNDSDDNINNKTKKK